MSLSEFFEKWKKQRAHQVRQEEARKAVKRQQKKVKAEEARRRQDLKIKNSALNRRLKAFQTWSKRKGLERQQRWEKLRSTNRVVRWLSRHQRLVFWLSVLIIAGLFTAFALRETKRIAENKADKIDFETAKGTAITVNGEKISLALYLKTLEMTHGPTVLQRMTEMAVIRQEAKRLGITISEEEGKTLEARVKDSPRRAILEDELRANLLLRKIALHEVSEERKREVYRDFQDELALYTLFGFRFESRDDAKKFLDEYRNGGLSLGGAAKKHSLDGSEPLFVGVMTLPQLERELGKPTADAVGALAVKGLTRPLAAKGKVGVYLLVKKETEFEKVIPSIDSLIAEAESNQILYQLLTKAKIESPFLERNLLQEVPSESPTPSPVPTQTRPGAPADSSNSP